MIGKLTGRIDYKADDHVLIDVQGVGYVVFCASPTLAMLPQPGVRRRFIPNWWCAKI